MNVRKLQSAKFKRDYIAYSAIGIFFFVVLAEFVLAVGIPLRVSRDGLFEEQIRLQQMIDLFNGVNNGLGRNLDRNEIPNADAREEALLVRGELMRLSVYLHEHAKSLTPDEIAAVHQRLAGMQSATIRLKTGRTYNQALDFDPTPWADREAVRLDEHFLKLRYP